MAKTGIKTEKTQIDASNRCNSQREIWLISSVRFCVER